MASAAAESGIVVANQSDLVSSPDASDRKSNAMTYLFRRIFTSFTRRPAGAAVAITFLWLLLCVWYVSTRIGWGALGTFLPHELGGFFAGIFEQEGDVDP